MTKGIGFPGSCFTMAGIVSNSVDLSSDKSDLNIKSITPIEETLLGILKEGPSTRDQLCEKLGLPRTTVYDGLEKLIKRNKVMKYPIWATERSRGRPQVAFSLLDDKK